MRVKLSFHDDYSVDSGRDLCCVEKMFFFLIVNNTI
jgi:hypothetical protein